MDAPIAPWHRGTNFTGLRKSTQAACRRIAESVRPKIGHRLVAQMQDGHVRRLTEAKADHPTAANHLLRILHLLMKHAIRERPRKDDPTRGFERKAYRTEGHTP